jgi:hypothetical protein
MLYEPVTDNNPLFALEKVAGRSDLKATGNLFLSLHPGYPSGI